MGQYEWLVFTCRACRRVIKLAPAMAGKHVVCPHCRTKVSVPKDAPIVEEEAAQSQIPVARVTEDMTNLRGREDWEVGQREIGGELKFKDKLHATSDPEVQRDPNRRRRKVTRRTPKHDAPDYFDSVAGRPSGRRGKERGDAFEKTFTKGLVAAVVVLFGVAVWLGIEKWKKPRPESARPPEAVQQETKLDPGADGKAKVEARSFLDYGPALALAVRKFCAAPSVEEMLPLVRDRARVEPKIRARYTDAKPWRPIEINNKFQPNDPVLPDGDFLVVTLKLPSGEEQYLTLERDGESFLVDWESFTGHGDLTWEELREKRPQQPVVMRVVVDRGPATEYWNDAFTNHTTHRCFLLHDMKSQHFLSGYTERNSSADLKLMQYLSEAPPAEGNVLRCFAIVSLSYPAGSQSGQQALIHEVLERGWVFREDR
jgi:hypothetical protein